jgi:nucleoside-diphosphate-sugar epimerase
MNRALITGVTGQDGAHLAEFLLEKGYEVHGNALLHLRPPRVPLTSPSGSPIQRSRKGDRNL